MLLAEVSSHSVAVSFSWSPAWPLDQSVSTVSFLWWRPLQPLYLCLDVCRGCSAWFCCCDGAGGHQRGKAYNMWSVTYVPVSPKSVTVSVVCHFNVKVILWLCFKTKIVGYCCFKCHGVHFVKGEVQKVITNTLAYSLVCVFRCKSTYLRRTNAVPPIFYCT